MRWMVAGVLLLWVGFAEPAAADDTPPVSARPEWKIYDQNLDPGANYVVYKRKPTGSDYYAYRLEAVIDAPPAVVAAAGRANIADPTAAQENMKKTLLHDDGEVLLVYTYIDLPMVSDRDVTTRAQRSFDPQTGTYRVEWRATDEGPPPKKGVVRLQESSGFWTFAPLEGGRTRATYESHTEIAGSIPVWIVNSLMTDTVVDGIVRLRARIDGDGGGEGG